MKRKKNFRKMPEQILQKLDKVSQNDIIVACVKKISASEIAAGTYDHLGLSLRDGKPVFPERVIPKPSVGRSSRINAKGILIVRRDLPKVLKTYSMEVPNFGDWSRGSHIVDWDRTVYRRDYFSPKELEIDIELLGEEFKTEQLFVFKFTVVEVLDKTKFSPEQISLTNPLFFNLNLLQENVSAADVFASTASVDDYLRSVFVEWEILPAGTRDENITRILSGVRAPSEESRRRLIAKYDLLVSLKPIRLISGVSGLRRYFGAQFADDLVVFENIEYGNAIYAMYERWEILSKLSRIELLKGDRNGFERIVHRKGWEDKLRALVGKHRMQPAA